MAIFLHLYILIIGLLTSQASDTVYLENCTYSLNLYKEYLNVLWASNDSRTLHIQAMYSLPSSSNKSFIPGHIYTYSSQSVAVIPFFVECLSTKNTSWTSLYLPFTQCSTTITNFLLRKNYESTRTNLNLKSILNMKNVPLVYIGEYNLILSNCSFKLNSTIYRLKSNERFSLRIEYESPYLGDCSSCNRRTSICYEHLCRCKSGTVPVQLHQEKQYCIDTTRNCAIDPQRCQYKKTRRNSYINQLICILILLISFVFILFISLIWFLFRNLKTNEKDLYSNQSIFIIDQNDQTPSTLTSINSIKSNVEHQYPKIIGEKNNGEILFILA